jgi:hypothetical protein
MPWLFLKNPLFLKLIGVFILIAILYAGYLSIKEQGRLECEVAVKLAEVEQLGVFQSKLAQEMARNDEISRRLSEAEQNAKIANDKLRAYSKRLQSCGNVPIDFVRLHDGAVQGASSITETTGEPACKASAVGFDAAADTIRENYATCNSCQKQLNALIDWANGLP